MSATDTFPRRLDFRRAALEGRSPSGTLSLDDLPRTRDVAVTGSSACITATLDFHEDSQRRVIVEGQAATTLRLPCQRCLEPADVPLALDIAGMAVSSDEAAAQVPREWEPMLADGESLDLYALIDDELLLGLPITVHCDRPECRARFDMTAETALEDTPAAEEKSNPFAALAALRTGSNNDTTD